MTVRLGTRSKIRAYRHMSGTTEVVYANPPATELHVWSRHLQEGAFFVDVGANAGVYTIWALERGAEVLAVEPNPLACRRFRENLALNAYEARLVEAAVSDREGEVLITVDRDVGNHLVLDDSGTPDRATPVPAVTLDALIGDRVVDGLKLDVEGAELLALQGAYGALADRRIKLMQLEWNVCSMEVTGTDRRSTAKLLQSHGYELLRADDDGNLSPTSDFSFGPDVFARPTS